MLYIEDYVVVNIGLVPDKNHDNIYLNGISLNENNNGINNYKVKIRYANKELIYAVFDGIGGLSKGEHASYMASNILSKNKNISNTEILNKISIELSKYSKEKNIKIGTTGSIVRIKNKKAIISLVGDSPVYILSNNAFTKLVEHEEDDNLLENYLGSTNQLHITEHNIKIKNGDKILICSDGLSKEVKINEIEYILKQSNDIKFIANKLMNYALKNGGKDNISIILIQVKRNYKEIIYTIIFILFILLIFIILK